LWGGVAGYVEADEEPYEAALKEIKEEAGLNHDAVRFVRQGDTVAFIDVHEGETYDWVVYPFVFYVEKKDKLHIDWEHSEYRWISPADIIGYDTVPRFKEIVAKNLV
jgi:hypothetical protein